MKSKLTGWILIAALFLLLGLVGEDDRRTAEQVHNANGYGYQVVASK